MKVKDIKKLPEEFNFKSNINPWGILYHAKKEKHRYKITWEEHGECYIEKKVFYRNLLKNNFIIY